MFRTEVVKSKNLRKSLFYKIYNAIAIILLAFIVSITLKLYGEDSSIYKLIQDNYTNIVQPLIMGIALLLFGISMYTRNAAKNPKRLGSIEIDENEIHYLVDDELQETILLSDIDSIDFEFFSFRMRGNPMGCMNYLTLNSKKGQKMFEIVIANTMVKAEFGELLQTINTKTPVKVKFAYFLKRILGDSDFKFEN